MNTNEIKNTMKDFNCDEIKNNLEKINQKMMPKMEKFKTPIINFPKDYKLEELCEVSNRINKISEKVENIEKNSKNPFWKNVLIAVIGGVIGGIITTLFSLIFV